MSFLSRWQPLRDEDAHTALVFGFLRHAPRAVALDRWLISTLGRPVSALPLERSAFWPSLNSIVDGSQLTEPELVFEASDGDLLTVVTDYDMFTVAELSREVFDVANATPLAVSPR